MGSNYSTSAKSSEKLMDKEESGSNLRREQEAFRNLVRENGYTLDIDLKTCHFATLRTYFQSIGRKSSVAQINNLFAQTCDNYKIIFDSYAKNVKSNPQRKTLLKKDPLALGYMYYLSDLDIIKNIQQCSLEIKLRFKLDFDKYYAKDPQTFKHKLAKELEATHFLGKVLTKDIKIQKVSKGSIIVGLVYQAVAPIVAYWSSVQIRAVQNHHGDVFAVIGADLDRVYIIMRDAINHMSTWFRNNFGGLFTQQNPQNQNEQNQNQQNQNQNNQNQQNQQQNQPQITQAYFRDQHVVVRLPDDQPRRGQITHVNVDQMQATYKISGYENWISQRYISLDPDHQQPNGSNSVIREHIEYVVEEIDEDQEATIERVQEMPGHLRIHVENQPDYELERIRALRRQAFEPIYRLT